MKLKLRPYQEEAVKSVYDHLRNRDDNPCVVLPTGTGKSLVLGKIASDAVTKWNGRVLILAHVKELLEQNAEKIRFLCPDVKVGIYSAGLKSRDTKEQIIVAGIQSVHKRAFELDAFDLIVIDEAHMVPPDGEGMYREFLRDAKLANPHVRVIGLTATPYRLKGGLICKPENILNYICYEAGLKAMINDGYLSPLIPKAGDMDVDYDSLHIKAGEFVSSEVETLVNNDKLVQIACKEIVELTKDRKTVLIFGCSVDHCKKIKKHIETFSGEECAIVTGDTPASERDVLLNRIKGKTNKDLFGNDDVKPLKFLANVSVLTTGFDAPNIDAIAILRPTASPGLLVQMCGRGLRLSPQTGKHNCLARGTLILTDHGEVPIEKVTKDMRLWDGKEFVKHEGTVCNGRRNVINFNGLVATPEHKVWTDTGWRTFEDCCRFNIPISVTAIDGKAIREDDGYFKHSVCDVPKRRACWEMDTQTQVCVDKMHMRRGSMEEYRQLQTWCCWLSCLRQAKSYSKMVVCKMSRGIRKMHEQIVSTLQGLWRSWNYFWVRLTNGDGKVYIQKLRYNKSQAGYRQDRQPVGILSREYTLDDKEYKPDEHKETMQNKNANLPGEASGDKICGCDIEQILYNGDERRGNNKEVLPILFQTEREVWDILNAGPRHRFTANGLLVSNCIILDYGENILRHGPLDAITVVEKKKSERKGEKPAKACPKCKELIETARTICPCCGYVFPPKELKHLDYASADGLITGQVTTREYNVDRVMYQRWTKRMASPDTPNTLCIEYNIGFNEYFREWVCPEHTGYARQKFVKWWTEHRINEDVPIPLTVDEAIELAHKDLLKYPAKITIRHVAGEKYDRISNYTYGERPGEYVQPYTLTAEDEAALLGDIEDYGCNSVDSSGDYVNFDEEVPF